jgi:DNA replication and repair protein RecF
MLISRVALADYKSFRSFAHDLYPGVNLVIAPNGSGKTNLLEAIYYLAAGESFRKVPEENVPSVGGSGGASVAALVSTPSGLEVELALRWEKNLRKVYYFNGKKTTPAKVKQYFKALTYAPNSLDLILNGGIARRQFLDTVLALLRPSYRQVSSSYRRVVLAKNKLLERNDIRDRLEQLKFWNQKLVELGGQITAERLALLDTLFPIMEEAAAEIYNLKDYSPSYELESRYLQHTSAEVNSLPKLISKAQANLAQKIADNSDKELFSHKTLYGPHRDDFLFKLGGQEVRYVASRGQQRLYGLIVHLAVLKLLDSEYNLPVVVLLDDLFSELDQTHRRKSIDYLVQLAKSAGNQIVITAPDQQYIPKEYRKLPTLDLS